MFRRLVVTGGACLALAACSDSAPPPTGIREHDVSTYAASGRVVITGFGRSDTLQASSHGALGKGLSLDRAGTSNGGGPVLPLLIVRDQGAQVASDGGTFRDAQGRLHRLVVESNAAGGPPRAFRHYINGTLVSTTTMQWERRAGAWVQRDLHVRNFKGDSASLEVHATAQHVNIASRSTGSRALVLLAARAARVFAPRDAVAQTRDCTREWQIYIMASGYAAAAAQALEMAVMSGNPGVIAVATTNYLLAVAAMCIAEYNVYLCSGGHMSAPPAGGDKPILFAPTRIVH
ncbi:MAG: hypothetical protein ACREOJ_16745 [Gemmatimonadaceae bacterium]